MSAGALVFMLAAWAIIAGCAVVGLASIMKHQK